MKCLTGRGFKQIVLFLPFDPVLIPNESPVFVAQPNGKEISPFLPCKQERKIAFRIVSRVRRGEGHDLRA